MLLVLFTAAALAAAAGCSKPPSDTKAPVQGAIGIMDMAKAIKAHPKYAELDRLNRELNTIAAQAEQRIAQQPAGISAGMPAAAGTGLSDALQQEFNAQMAQKQSELQKRLDAEANALRSKLSDQMRQYAAEIDKEYQPQIFSFQLKLKTVQLAKEEAEKIQKEIESLQSARNTKLAAKEKELAASLEAEMLPLQKAAEQEMSVYAQELNAKNQRTFAQKSAEIAARSGPAPSSLTDSASLEQQAGMKKQEIAALEQYIIKDIRDKAAKVAIDKKLDTVLANVRINIQAVDITDLVIAEFKK